MKNSIRNRNAVVSGTRQITFASATSGVTTINERLAGNKVRTTLIIASYTQAVASANLAFGKQIYTFPEGYVSPKAFNYDITISAAASVVAPVMAFGNTVGAGAVNTLAGTAGFFDMNSGGQDTLSAITVAGTRNKSTIAGLAAGTFSDGTAGAKKIYLNFAGGWATSENLTISGKVVFEWEFGGDD